MARHYKAVTASSGFRGRYWEAGQIAEDVKPDENIPEHFEPIGKDAPEEQTPKPKEPETLAELQELEYPSKKRGRLTK